MYVCMYICPASACKESYWSRVRRATGLAVHRDIFSKISTLGRVT